MAELERGIEPQRPGATLVISSVCAVLLVAHVAIRSFFGTIKDGIDPVAFGLALVGLSPWIASILKTLKVGGVELSFQQIEATVKEQGHEIEQLKFLIANFLPHWEFEHLKKLAGNEPFMVDLDHSSAAFEGELRHLRSMNFIRHTSPGSVAEFLKGQPRTKNVADYFELTDSGKQYLAYREQACAAGHRDIALRRSPPLRRLDPLRQPVRRLPRPGRRGGGSRAADTLRRRRRRRCRAPGRHWPDRRCRSRPFANPSARRPRRTGRRRPAARRSARGPVSCRMRQTRSRAACARSTCEARKASPSSSAAIAPRCRNCATPEVEYWTRFSNMRPSDGCAPSQPMRQPVIAQFLEKVLTKRMRSSGSAMSMKDAARRPPKWNSV